MPRPYPNETPEERRDARIFFGLASLGFVLVLVLLTACVRGQL